MSVSCFVTLTPQALNDSPVPVHLQLGKEGLGAGNKPEKARQAAEDTIEEIKQMLSDGTKMAFITAGMGGGTGTGAAPVIARVSKDMGILTVGIVTIPFRFEGNKKIDQALDGVEEMAKQIASTHCSSSTMNGSVRYTAICRSSRLSARPTTHSASRQRASRNYYGPRTDKPRLQRC